MQNLYKSHWTLRLAKGFLLALVCVFFIFPLLWVVKMSFESNKDILTYPPSFIFKPTLYNYKAIILGNFESEVASLQINYIKNIFNSFILAFSSVVVSLILGVPAAYAFARYRFRLGENIAFTLLSFRFAPPLLVLLPLLVYFQRLNLYDTYLGLIWVYQLITLPLILWIVRGYFEDLNPEIEEAYRIDGHSWLAMFFKISIPLAKPGIAAATLLAFIFAWNNFIFALILGSADIQPVTVGALAFITASGINYGQIAAALIFSIIPTLTLAIYAQRYIVQGLSLGAIKG